MSAKKNRWYKTRKPKLAVEILGIFALGGKLSKSMVETTLKGHHYYHADILNAFKILQNNEFIEGSGGEVGGRGGRRVYYKITADGLKTLIADDPTPQKFWRAMIGFCHHNDKPLSLAEVNEFYKFFNDKYLEYSSIYGYSFQIDSFNNVCKNWIEKKVLKSNKIIADQKLLEALALLEPPVTLGRLSKEIGESVNDIKKVLSKYTPIQHKPLVIPGEGFTKDYFKTHKVYDMKNPGDFLLHYTVEVRKGPKDNILLQLSLFGIILVLTLVRYSDMGRLKHGLYFSNIQFQQYYDKIASNYKNKLPLIFGKWYLLKRILKVFSAYNFDAILDKETRLRSIDKLILEGGKREIYDGSKAIALHSHKQMGELQAKGLEILANYMSNPNRYVLTDNTRNTVENHDHQKIKALWVKIFEIINLLTPFVYDPNSYVETLMQGSNRLIDKHAAAQLSRSYETDNIDELFANEINSLYYLTMLNEDTFQVMHPMNYYASMMSKAEEEYFASLKKKCMHENGEDIITSNKESNQQLQNQKEKGEDRYSIMPGSLELPPKERLVSILESDEDIREWFSKWLGDLLNYQNKTINKINTIYEEIETLKAN